MMTDVLIIGAGPAGLALAAALCDQGVRVAGLAPGAPATRWVNTYGIWADELAQRDLGDVR
ncbi:MAG: FAD-dependent monooxygenase, partial [Caldilineaceae bacterium]|nr:FAD-dependent monooxygenase [Caldilineaceae bacterium]